MDTALHIGTEKTGSTTLQLLLTTNRARLARRGIAIPTSVGTGNNRDLATYAIRDNYFDEDALISHGITDDEGKRQFKERVEDSFRAEIERLSQASYRMIISSEHLQSRLKADDEVTTLKSLLQGCGLNVASVIVYLREQASLYSSLYSTALRVGSSAPPPTRPIMPHWNHIGDHRATLQRWSRVFPAAQMVPRIYERAAFSGGRLTLDFAQATAIDGARLDVPRDQNVGISAAGQELVRRMNAQNPWLMEPTHAPLRAEVLRYVDRMFAGEGSRPSAELAAACAEHFREGNEWVRHSYFPDRDRLFREPVPSDSAADETKKVANAERWIVRTLTRRRGFRLRR